jgi:hypothetical protein
MQYWPLSLPAMIVVGAGTLLGMPAGHADGDNNTLIPNNKRLNDGVVANVFTVQHQAGCTNDVKINPQLQLAAQRHARDVLNNRTLDGDIGSDGSTPETRGSAAGYRGRVAEMGVWSENSIDRTVVVAMYGQPERPVAPTPLGSNVGLPPPVVLPENVPLDPSPDYDAQDEIEYGINWFPWILRGVYPPPAMPPQ